MIQKILSTSSLWEPFVSHGLLNNRVVSKNTIFKIAKNRKENKIYIYIYLSRRVQHALLFEAEIDKTRLIKGKQKCFGNIMYSVGGFAARLSIFNLKIILSSPLFCWLKLYLLR